MFIPGAIAVFWGAWSRQRTFRILVGGAICKARIRSVSSLPWRFGDRTFSHARLEVATPDGGTAQALDMADNYALDMFFSARDEDREIEALFNPSYPTKAIAMARLMIALQWD